VYLCLNTRNISSEYLWNIKTEPKTEKYILNYIGSLQKKCNSQGQNIWHFARTLPGVNNRLALPETSKCRYKPLDRARPLTCWGWSRRRGGRGWRGWGRLCGRRPRRPPPEAEARPWLALTSRASVVAAGVAASSRVLRVQVAAWLGLSHLCIAQRKKHFPSRCLAAFSAVLSPQNALCHVPYRLFVYLSCIYSEMRSRPRLLCVPLTHLRYRHRTHAARTLNFFCINYYKTADCMRLWALLFGTCISSAEPRFSINAAIC